MTDQKRDTPKEFDEHMGAVEADRATDPQGGNPNGTGIDSQGMPNDPVGTCEDVLGANLDEAKGG